MGGLLQDLSRPLVYIPWSFGLLFRLWHTPSMPPIEVESRQEKFKVAHCQNRIALALPTALMYKNDRRDGFDQSGQNLAEKECSYEASRIVNEEL